MKACTFSDVLIKPKYSEIKSRKDVDLSTDLGSMKLSLPLISSNMKTITGPEMAFEMYTTGALGILHRFCTIDQSVEDFKTVIKLINFNLPLLFPNIKSPIYKVGVSIGVQKKGQKRFKALYKAGARIFAIDVAHGDHISVKKMLHWIRNQKIDQKKLILIAGNVATIEGVENLAKWGANWIKVGIGSGSCCMTRRNTGIGIPQLDALENAYVAQIFQKYECNRDIKIISDGGISSPGDIVKALKYADLVMVGSMLAGTTETPGKVFKNKNNQYYKVYMGSASGENKHSSNQETDFIEGIASEILFKGRVKYVLKEIKEGIQSACSYVGAKNLKEFKDKCEFVRITDGARVESKI